MASFQTSRLKTDPRMGQLAQQQVRDQRDQQRRGTAAGGGQGVTDTLRLLHGQGVGELLQLGQQLRDQRDQRRCGTGAEVGQDGTETPRLLHGQEVAKLLQQGQQLRDLYDQRDQR